jgi:amidase
MTMGVGSTLDEAAKEALGELGRLVRQRHRLDEQEVAMLLSIACDVHVAQLVNPLVGVKAKVPEHLLTLP